MYGFWLLLFSTKLCCHKDIFKSKFDLKFYTTIYIESACFINELELCDKI